MNDRTRYNTPLLLSGLGVIAALGVEVALWHGGGVRLPLLIARGEGFPVPLLYWGSLLVHALVYVRSGQATAAQSCRRILAMGFASHMIVLVATLAWQCAHQADAFESIWYARYWLAVLAGLLALGAGGAVTAAGRWRTARAPGHPWQLYLPLLAGYACLWGTVLVIHPWLTAGATIGGVWLALLAQRDDASWIRRSAFWTHERLFLAAVFLVALALRLFYLARVMTSSDYLNTGSDGPVYDQVAWALVQHEPGDPWNLPLLVPGYVRFVALLYWLGGRSYTLVCGVQAVLGAATCLLVYDIARRLFGKTVGVVSAVFVAINFPAIFAAAAIGHQGLDIFLTAVVVWCLVGYTEHPERWGRWLFPVGAVFGWAAATREGNVVFWGAIVIWMMWGTWAKLGWRRALTHTLMFGAGFVCIILPILAADMHRYGGQERSYGRLGFMWFKNTETDLQTWFNPFADPAGAWARVVHEPLNVVRKLSWGMWGNFERVYFNQTYGRFDPVFLVRQSTYHYGLLAYAYLLVITGTVVVLWRSWRAPVERLGWLILPLLLGSRTLVHVLFEASYRHRAPLEPYLIMLAAYGCVWWLNCPWFQRSTQVGMGSLPVRGHATQMLLKR